MYDNIQEKRKKHFFHHQINFGHGLNIGLAPECQTFKDFYVLIKVNHGKQSILNNNH